MICTSYRYSVYGLIRGDRLGPGCDTGGQTLYVVELLLALAHHRIYFANAGYANGVLEGINYYDFLGRIRIPNDVA